MTLPDYFKQTLGTAVVWGQSGATGVTKTLSLDGLISTEARMGASADLGEFWDREQILIVQIETGTAPTAGNTVDVYFACSHDNSTWPAGVTGSDAFFRGTADNDEAEWLKLLGSPAVSLIATNDGPALQTQNAVIWRPSGRYVVPVVHNQLGQAIRDEQTDTNNDSRIILVPLIDRVND